MDDRPQDHGDEKPTQEKKTESKSTESKKTDSKISDITDKLPDISGLTSKFDLDKILGGIKSMINPEEGAASSVTADPDDALGMKIEQLSSLLQELNQTHAQLAKNFAKANDILVSLFKDLEAVRKQK